MKILLVDDNEITLDLEKLMLESYGLTVSTASSGAEAVEMLRSRDFSMVFMDINMPDMNGFEAAKRIRSFNSHTPIIALSADTVECDNADFVSGGMNGALKKPLQFSKLKELLMSYGADAVGEPSVKVRKSNVIFDYDELHGVLSDDKAMYQVLNQFLLFHSGDCELLKKHIFDGDLLSAREIMHNIIGISGNLVCRKLYAAAELLGAELRGERYDSLGDFAAIWDQTVDALKKCVTELAERYAPAPDADWETVKNDFLSLCADFDISAYGIFRDNKSLFEAVLPREVFEKTYTAIRNYDFSSITDMREKFDV